MLAFSKVSLVVGVMKMLSNWITNTLVTATKHITKPKLMTIKIIQTKRKVILKSILTLVYFLENFECRLGNAS